MGRCQLDPQPVRHIAVASVQGGTQALSRSLYGRLIPLEKSAEFFGFYDISQKFSGIVGPAVFALIGQLTGRLKKAEVITAACKGCGVCVSYCPAKAITAGTVPVRNTAAVMGSLAWTSPTISISSSMRRLRSARGMRKSRP